MALQENTGTTNIEAKVNLFPERRKQNLQRKAQAPAHQTRAETDTSKYFMHLETPQTMSLKREMEIDDDDADDDDVDDVENGDNNQESDISTDSDEDSEPVAARPARKQQMKLDFSNGVLTAKKPLTNPIRRDDTRRLVLKDVAAETLLLLPGLLATRPDVRCDSFLCQKETVDAKFNPGNPPATVQVFNLDTIDAALAMQQRQSPGTNHRSRPVAILNMANASTPGGGWKHGALAQEEALCYRSSLFFTFKRKHYPIPDDAAIYSPNVMVIRESMQDGHDLLDFRDPRKLNVLAVISCAAVCLPSTSKDATTGLRRYAVQADRRLMMEKMRIILRTAIRNRHRQIVLGALGCGAFGNPNNEVAAMWKIVLQETEFQGGWWETMVFAVMGNGKPGNNYRVFFDELDGLVLK